MSAILILSETAARTSCWSSVALSNPGELWAMHLGMNSCSIEGVIFSLSNCTVCIYTHDLPFLLQAQCFVYTCSLIDRRGVVDLDEEDAAERSDYGSTAGTVVHSTAVPGVSFN